MEKPGSVLFLEVKYDGAAEVLTLRQKGATEALVAKIGVLNKPPRSLPITATSYGIQLPKLKVAEISQAALGCIFVKFQGQISYTLFVFLFRHSSIRETRILNFLRTWVRFS